MKVIFNINFYTVWGQKLFVVGSLPELGAWEPALAREMHYAGDGNWQLELELPPDTRSIEYRYFLSAGEERIFEEWEKNHRITFDGTSGSYSLYDYWQVRPTHLAYYTSAFTKSLYAHPCNTHERVVRSDRKLIIKVLAPRIARGQSVAITGNQPCLGGWDPKQALPLGCDHFPEWHIELDANAINYPMEYKFLVVDDDKRQPLYWEGGDNRKLNLPEQAKGETAAVSGLYFRDVLPLWRGAGTVIPVFSLRTEQSFGTGDLGDLRLMVDWIRKTRQHIIQVLPMNDTTRTHSWMDSYPYSAISIYALHPMYINLHEMGLLKDRARAAYYAERQKELNALPALDYTAVMQTKMAYCREYFAQEGAARLASPEFEAFRAANAHWLMPYAAYCCLRDRFGTSDFTKWKEYARYDEAKIRNFCRQGGEAWAEISFHYFLQYILHLQFKAVRDYAHKQGVILKGDLPIGVNRTSIEVWTEPDYFNRDGQAGAPPDDFAVEGQNWHFPTYNWTTMERDNFAWWKKRFAKMGDYFDSFRIDHILGFFRIWEIPDSFEQGLCGHFNPALPLSPQEIEQYGLPFDRMRFTVARIHEQYLDSIFGDLAGQAKDGYLARETASHYVLKPFCDTQRKMIALFAGKENDKNAMRLRNGLMAIANEVLFLEDPKEKGKYHPRISASQSFAYKELNASERYAFDQLYWNFFYHRHNDFWKKQAMERLTPLVGGTEMLVCGEDLGMIPASVPEVMNKLQILSLEIERMPKEAGREFADLMHLPYNSVCSTSTHDMSPLRAWWREDAAKTQRYYNHVLHHEGDAPADCSAQLAEEIVANHLHAPSMLAILPLQDWMATDDAIKNPNCEMERINVPADSNHYWRYRMHVTIEKLLVADDFNRRIIRLIDEAGRQ